ncbi:chorismate--pyruvate lyase family protein [Cysteiniphilum halobium]|uniref:chorismate--pyruvate lyase family protein n=1 Tax=Cysteiniphilum halobium TaxID=2219059 RepID=UPI003F87C219
MTSHWNTKETIMLPTDLKYWLFDVKRLGVTLAQLIPNISLHCIKEYHALMDDDEAELLNLSERTSRIRLIKHYHQDNIYVFGRTIIPQNTYKRYQDCFDSLGNNSIGEHFLFKNTHIKRSEFYVKQCPFDLLEHKLNLNDGFSSTPLWMRASIFTLDVEHQLLIEEFFVRMPPV